MTTIETLNDLLLYLQKLTPKQRKQPLQIIESSPMLNSVLEMKPGLLIGTLKEMEIHAARSSVDNKFHPEDIAVMIDGNPFAEDGAIAYSYKPDLSDKNKKTKKSSLLGGTPQYGKNGKTKPKDQINPLSSLIKRGPKNKQTEGLFTHEEMDFPAYEKHLINKRITNMKNKQ